MRRWLAAGAVCRRFVAASVAALCLLSGTVATAKTQRPFNVTDLLRLESIGGNFYGGPFAYAKRGERIAFVRERSRERSPAYVSSSVGADNGRSEIWVQLSPNTAPMPILDKPDESTGYWAPQWSPDGTRLALLSNRGGSVGLWVWELPSRTLQRLSDQPPLFDDGQPFVWLDAQRLLYAATTSGSPAAVDPIGTSLQAMTKAWNEFATGTAVTASILESQKREDERLNHGTLMVIDLTGRGTSVAHNVSTEWVPSPDGEFIAWTSSVTARQDHDGRFWDVRQVAVSTMSGRPLNFDGNDIGSVVMGTLRWSPSIPALAFLAVPRASEEARASPEVYILSTKSGLLTRCAISGFQIVTEPDALEWDGRGGLLVRARVVQSDQPPRFDWWHVKPCGQKASLTQPLNTPPARLFAQPGNRFFAAVADGALWRIDSERRTLREIKLPTSARIDSIVWPSSPTRTNDALPRGGRTYARILVRTVAPDRSLWEVDILSTRATRYEIPSLDIQVAAHSPQRRDTLYVQNDQNGMRLWRNVGPLWRPQILFSTNEFLRDVAEGEFRNISYRSLDGRILRGRLILPYRYDRSRRYPLITWVYPGAIVDDSPDEAMRINSFDFLNPQIAAAHGYAVLFPSIPLAPYGTPEDPLMRVPDGVLPAVDAVVKAGIADPDQVFVVGHSFGGFATYALAAQTSRFKAGVAIAGFSDLISLYGTFDGSLRYGGRGHEDTVWQRIMERGQTRMGVPPWKDPDRYVRNSPIMLADRVETPLLIIHGDMDFIPMQQAEEFFRAMVRQGNCAKFVRYWGEGHRIESAANIQDMWQRILEWLDGFSGKKSGCE